MARSVFVYEYVSGGGLDLPGDSGLRGAAPALLDEGLAMRDALLADLAAAHGAAGLSLHCAVGRGVARPRGAAAVAPAEAEAPAAFLRRAAAGCDAVWVVAPETGGVLAALAEAIAPARWVGCTPAAIALCSSKAATTRQLAAAGLPTPQHLQAQATHWIVKPDDGAGGLAMRRHATQAAARADVAARHAAGQTAVAEPWVDGEALSLSLCCSAGVATLLAINRQHVATSADGGVHYVGVTPAALPLDGPRGPHLRDLAAAIAAALPGLAGWVGVDLVWHPVQGPVLIEINPRLTGAYVGLAAALGRPLAGALLDAGWGR